MLKIPQIYISLVSYFFLCGVEGQNCGNQLNCLLQDPLGKLLQNLTTNCITNSSDVQYWLYTPNNTVQLQPGDLVDSNKPVNVLIHGWGGNRNSSYIQVIKNAYLQRYGWERTIIVVDYGMYTRAETVSLSLYANSYCNLPPISANVASFLCKLRTSSGVDPDDIHVIGHSLGAHVSGIAGWYLQQNCNATIGRITGLDAASPGFICPLCNNFRLDWSDAKFVDVIHTDIFLYGTALKSGDVDFFVNHGGPFQPGCFSSYHNDTAVSLLENPLLILLMPVACSHQRSCDFFAESIILNDFFATSCTLAANTPLACLYVDQVYMGEYCKERQAYDFYGVSTKAEFPYGYGPRGPLY